MRELITDEYVDLLCTVLSGHADSGNAAQMQRYMKDLFPFYGINSPQRSILFRKFIADAGKPSLPELNNVIHSLYEKPERELHYFAMLLAEKYIRKLTLCDIKLFEYMIVTKSWWDTVDFIASHLVGKFFSFHPGSILPVTLEWMDSGNIWLQRSCLLFQLKYRDKTDIDLLYSFIDRLKDSNEFFIRKAIGWALREYSKVRPSEVLIYVSEHPLKPLSRREALKIINRNTK